MVRPFCSIERSDECETAVSLLGLIIHMICSMRWADALYGHEGRGFSIAGDVHGWLPIAPIHVIPVETCEAIAAMSFAIGRGAPPTDNRDIDVFRLAIAAGWVIGIPLWFLVEYAFLISEPDNPLRAFEVFPRGSQ